MTGENGELCKRLSEMEQKDREARASAGKCPADVCFITEEQDASAVKCEKLALEVQCMHGLSEGAMNVRE